MRSTDTILPHLAIRPYQHQDYAALAALIEASYDFTGADVVPSQYLVNLVANLHPSGQLTAWVDNQLVGAMLCRKVPVHRYRAGHTEAMAFDTTRFVEDDRLGNALYLLDLIVLPAFRKVQIGSILREQTMQEAFNQGVNFILGLSRLSGFHRYQTQFSVETYVQKVVAGELTDPILSFHLSYSTPTEVVRIVPNCIPSDTKSCGYSAILQVTNPHPKPLAQADGSPVIH